MARIQIADDGLRNERVIMGQDEIERNMGVQPLDDIMAEHALGNHDLVNACEEPITHKAVQRARKGRRLTKHMQRRVADAAGCGFFDQQAAMGGEGAMLKWAEEEPIKAAKDRVHFTKDGYTLLGTALSTAVLRAFDAARVEPTP